MAPSSSESTTQIAYGLFHDGVRELRLPAAHLEAIPGLRWGEVAEVFTPAFWIHQVWLFDLGARPQYRLGESLVEEVAVCILGGFGFRSEVGWAAFENLRINKLLSPGTPADAIEACLRLPLEVSGRKIRYRFPRQKARYLAGFLHHVAEYPIPEFPSGRELRDWLLQFRGIGPKTASWIARNWLNCDDVAIIDIHIYRAGLLTNFFHPSLTVERNYPELESQFIRFAESIGARPSDLDAVMWEQMRNFGDYALHLLQDNAIPISDSRAIMPPA